MIRIQGQIEAGNLKTQMIMQVHDELVFEVPEGELREVCPLIKNEMEAVMNLSVPLKVSVYTGKTWAEAH
jgi:DNA polymerase-1